MDKVDIYVNDSTSSDGSTASTKRVIDVPFCGKTNTKTALFWTQLLVSGAAVSIGATFCGIGIVSASIYFPLLSGIVGYWLPSPSI